MRLPRWLVTTLWGLSLMLTLGVAAWLWTSWPTWITAEFVEFVANDKFEEARGMIADPDVEAAFSNEWLGAFRGTEILWQPRTLTEFILGRQRFKIRFHLESEEPYEGVFELAAERGSIVDGRSESGSP